MIDRRALVVSMGAVLAGVPVVRAQGAPLPVVGYLNGVARDEWVQPLGAFRKGLAEAGYAEGRDVAVEYRWADGHYDRLAALAAELVRLRVAVIAATGGSVAAVRAQAATRTIPIVFGMGADPTRLGLVTTLSRPGGNVTGVYFLTGQLEAKRLGILRELMPAAPLIGVLVNPNLVSARDRVRDIEAAASAVGQRLHVVYANDDPQIVAAFATFAQVRVAALQVGADPYFLTRRDRIVSLAAQHGMPAIYEQREFADAGGLMSYGTNLVDASREVGVYVARVLKGEKPAEMPVVQSTKFEFVINLRTARQMRIAIPQSLSLRADDVIT